MSFKILSPRAVEESYHRIKDYINHTRLVRSPELENKLGHIVHFKLENEQKLGCFKTRGVLNTLLKLKEQALLPEHVVAYSTGNHARAIAYATSLLGCKATIVMPENVTFAKQKAARDFNAEVIITKTRQEAEELTASIAAKGSYLIPPSDHDMVIAGNGTACYEALKEIIKVDAVFIPCGGGGMASGSYLATKLIHPNAKVFASEPSIANDAHLSVKEGKIFRFSNTPITVADGANTLGVTPRIFHYLKLIAGFYEIEEEEIIKSMIDIKQMLGVICEPTSALAIAACYKWLSEQKSRKEVLVIITGGNIDETRYNQLVGEYQNS